VFARRIDVTAFVIGRYHRRIDGAGLAILGPGGELHGTGPNPGCQPFMSGAYHCVAAVYRSIFQQYRLIVGLYRLEFWLYRCRGARYRSSVSCSA
jgi:hypothetical protein